MTDWSYVILERDDEGTIVDSHDATSEVLFLYQLIDMQERTLRAYRKELGYSFLDEPLTKH